jgi:hypothetical protein
MWARREDRGILGLEGVAEGHRWKFFPKSDGGPYTPTEPLSPLNFRV